MAWELPFANADGCVIVVELDTKGFSSKDDPDLI
jgi:hypothetical protein